VQNKNITLRYIKEGDIADYVRWTTTETEWCQWDAPWEDNDSGEFVQRQRNSLGKTPERYSKLEIDTAHGRHIGWVSAYKVGNEWACTHKIESEKLAVGVDIPAVSDRGQGYGYNALVMFMKYLFEHENLLYTQTWSGNMPMIHLAEKIGFTECDRLPNFCEVRGQKYDALTFSITKSDFFKINW